MSETRFISDLHIGHEAIIRFDTRPYRDKKHMWYSMRDAWNKVVKKDDLTYILGDMLWTKDATEALRYLRQLNGLKVLIKGNHDFFLKRETVLSEFEDVKDYAEIKIGDQNIVLSHYPIASWKHMQGIGDDRQGAWIHLHGHLHMTREFFPYINFIESLSNPNQAPLKAYNVGCMCPWINYVPRTLEEIERGYERWKGQYKDRANIIELSEYEEETRGSQPTEEKIREVGNMLIDKHIGALKALSSGEPSDGTEPIYTKG